MVKSRMSREERWRDESRDVYSWIDEKLSDHREYGERFLLSHRR